VADRGIVQGHARHRNVDAGSEKQLLLAGDTLDGAGVAQPQADAVGKLAIEHGDSGPRVEHDPHLTAGDLAIELDVAVEIEVERYPVHVLIEFQRAALLGRAAKLTRVDVPGRGDFFPLGELPALRVVRPAVGAKGVADTFDDAPVVQTGPGVGVAFRLTRPVQAAVRSIEEQVDAAALAGKAQHLEDAAVSGLLTQMLGDVAALQQQVPREHLVDRATEGLDAFAVEVAQFTVDPAPAAVGCDRLDLLHALELDVVPQPASSGADGAEDSAVATDTDVTAALQESQRLERLTATAPAQVRVEQPLGRRRGRRRDRLGRHRGRRRDRLGRHLHGCNGGKPGAGSQHDDDEKQDGDKTLHVRNANRQGRPLHVRRGQHHACAGISLRRTWAIGLAPP